MTPAKPSARRLLAGGTLAVALGALGIASAAPASAGQLVWANAQAWVTDGDLVTGYSTAISFGGDTEDGAEAEELFGPLAEYAEVTGESSTLVDDEGSKAESVVERASVRLSVDDLIDLGMVDPAGEGAEGAQPSEPPSASPSAPPSGPPEEGRDGPDGQGESEPGAEGGDRGDSSGDREPQRAEETDPDTPRASPSASPSAASPAEDEDTVILGEGGSDNVSADGNALEFTLSDLRSSAVADYDGQTEATFEHGELTAFGDPVPHFDGDHTVEDTLEVFDEASGDLLDEVPVSVRFLVNESGFEDEDEDWVGEGIRSSLTVWVQVGEPDRDNGFAVDFADSWAIGATHVSATKSDDGDRGGEELEETAAPSSRLATTGSSIVALVTAAVVAVGGGAAASFLARKRTTAMDDQIED